MIKVYIASPYTAETAAERLTNVKRSLEASDELIRVGFVPYAPLLSHYQDEIYPQSYGTWLALGLEWLDVCDCVLRLPGESRGADVEVSQAKSLGIMVFDNIFDIIQEYS